MSADDPHVPFDAPLATYQSRAERLLAQLQARDASAEWRVKWAHPRFLDAGIGAVRAATLSLADTRAVVAREAQFEHWPALADFVQLARTDSPVARFERAADAVVAGDLRALEALLGAHPALVHARSARRHGATLLHYLAANGVEPERQRTPPEAVDVATHLLEAGAPPGALATMYGRPCTTMSLLVSSTPPHDVGLQLALAETLLAYGASLAGPDGHPLGAVRTALAFGFADTARALLARQASAADIVCAAALGDTESVIRFLPSADASDRHAAVALAAQHGQAAALAVLLDAGEDPGRANPDGLHAHATPLHQAALGNHIDVVRLLVARGAPLDRRDRVYEATPREWAEHAGHAALAAYLRGAER